MSSAERSGTSTSARAPPPKRSCRPIRSPITPSSGSSTSPLPVRVKLRSPVGDGHHGFQPAQVTIRAPILGQLDAGALKLVRITLQLAFEPLEQGERIRRGAGETGDHGAACADPADLARVSLNNGLTHADLAVPGHGDFTIPPYAQDRGAMPPNRVGCGVEGVLHGRAKWRCAALTARAALTAKAHAAPGDAFNHANAAHRRRSWKRACPGGMRRRAIDWAWEMTKP